jgi:T5SS/PEP-CTERM-associated repeat protein
MAALGLALLATTPSRAQTANWTGANSTDWFDFINNWAFGFPTAGTDVFIDTVNPNPTVVDSHVPGAEALKVRVGVSSTGMLTIQNGGTANFILSIIGDQSGSTGTVTVDGNGSTWSSIFFEVGLSGTGTLTIRNGAVVDGSDGIIGGDPGSTGTVTVDGAGSSWTLDFAFLVGVEGTGTLTIRNGAR